MRTATKGKLKGTELRAVQNDAVEFVEHSKKRFICVRGPTGVGKTCLGFESMREPFYYVCSSIALQNQAVNDYPEASIIKGRNNYPCPDYGTCDLCIESYPCARCEYDQAKRIGFANSQTILNFHYFMFASNFSKNQKGEHNFPIRNTIIDEADELEQALVNFVSFEFRMNVIANLGINIYEPKKKTVMGAMKEWLYDCLKQGRERETELKEEVQAISNWQTETGEELSSQDKRVIRKLNTLKNMLWKMEFLGGQDLEGGGWIYRHDSYDSKILLKPVWLSRSLTDRFLFNRGINFLFMSATLPSKPVFCGLLGLKAEEVDYIDLPNIWTSERRKIICAPSYNMTKKTRTDDIDDQMRGAVKRVLAKEKGRGVIHTVSYSLAKALAGVSSRFISHSSKDKHSMYDLFRKTDGAVWVSPSSTRGLDLPYELCEFIIWLKAPFLHLRDPQVNARLYGSGKFGKEWYASDTIQTIIQGCGRGFRNEDDFCTVYFLDEQIQRLLITQQSLFPRWFRELVQFR